MRKTTAIYDINMLVLLIFLAATYKSVVAETDPNILTLLKYFEASKAVQNLAKIMEADDNICQKHIRFYFEQIRNISPWALQMLDASTKIPESILMGQFIHLGNFDECLLVERVQGPNNDTFDGQHCLVTYSLPVDFLKQPSSILADQNGIFHELNLPENGLRNSKVRTGAGLADIAQNLNLQLSYCLPSSCNQDDVRNYFNMTMNNLSDVIQVPAVRCSQGSKGRPLLVEDWITMAMLIFFGCLCIISTSYDILTENNKNRIVFLTAFSWYTNGKKLLSTSESGPDTLHALHGIRFISMSWVVMGHSYATVMAIPSINALDMKDFVSDFWRLYITSAFLSVDTFFVLSGLLVAYTFLKQMNKTKNASFNIPLYYFHRYIRLTPPYAITVLIHATLLRHMGAGPLWDMISVTMSDSCQTHWWTSLLYVNNYVATEKMCVGQGWYLAVDMQLFLLSPIILIPLWKWSKKLSLTFLATLILCGLAIAFSVSQIKELNGNALLSDNNTQRLQYIPTHTRFTPWLIGVLFGFLIYETKRRKFQVSKTYALLGWLIGASALLGALIAAYPFYQFDSETTQLENSLYTAFSHSVWALGVAWVAFACISGVGGPINTFLSWRVFQPLSRLTYCVFLVHMTYQLVRAFSTRVPVYAADVVMVPNFISDLFISLMLAVVLSLCFESPVIVLEKHILRKGSRGCKPAKNHKIPHSSSKTAASHTNAVVNGVQTDIEAAITTK